MTDDSTDTGTVRMDVLAVLVAFDAPASRVADIWLHADGRPYSDAEADLIGGASIAEWELAEALRGGPDAVSGQDAAAIAALLRIAVRCPLGPALAIGLRAEFLDREPRGGAAAFADVYRRLALPGMSGDDLKQATTLLDGLCAATR